MHSRPWVLLVYITLALALVMGGLRWLWPSDDSEYQTVLSVSDILGEGSETGFARALAPIPFHFPRDHGPHPDFRTEWWYVTGNLHGPEGREIGFQFTLFRSSLAPQGPESVSAWATNQVYMGHLAISDVGAGEFRYFERFSRGALELSGVQVEPFRAWIGDWELAGPEAAQGVAPDGGDIFPLRLRAAQGDWGVSIVLTPEKPMVLQGNQGLSKKGPGPGNASFYYSFTRIAAEGTVSVGEEIPVRGSAWFDREWSTSSLSSGQVGWDWFALQLADGRELMYYQLRHGDGSPDTLSKGILVSRDGQSTHLLSSDLELSVLDHWESPVDGTSYPSEWELAIPGEELTLTIRPLMEDQELNLTFRYWEGAVLVEGTDGERPVEGRGYVELTGYSDPAGRGGEPGEDPGEDPGG